MSIFIVIAIGATSRPILPQTLNFLGFELPILPAVPLLLNQSGIHLPLLLFFFSFISS